MIPSKLIRTPFALALVAAFAAPVDARCHRRAARRATVAACYTPTATPACYSTPRAVASPQGYLPAAAPAAANSADAGGFVAWLNSVRARHGRGAVGLDPNLAGWAAANNGQQQARGMGHHVMGPSRRQNSGMGAAPAVWSMWMASPAHQAALLDPTITMVGIAQGGSYWTFNAY